MARKTWFDIKYFFLTAIIFLAIISGTYSDINGKLSSDGEDYILCRVCGADIADAKHIINHLSPEASVFVNQTLFDRKGVEVQLLKNPLGIQFLAITLSNSKCAAVNNWQNFFSWYPQYAWKPCICKQCRAHHGWLYEPLDYTNLNSNIPSDKGFFLLKLDNLLSENFANSLIVIPKSYRN